MLAPKVEIQIRLSKSKIAILTFAAFSLFAGAIMIFTLADWQTETIVMKIISIAGIVFFGISGFYGVYKIFDDKPGLTMNRTGLIENTSMTGGLLIKWTDITGIKPEQVESTKILLIFVRNPDYYIKEANFLKRFLLKMNDRVYGTPVTITANSLKCKFEELVEEIENRIKKYGF